MRKKQQTTNPTSQRASFALPVKRNNNNSLTTMSPAQPVTTFWRLAGMSYLQVSVGDESGPKRRPLLLSVMGDPDAASNNLTFWAFRVSFLC